MSDIPTDLPTTEITGQAAAPPHSAAVRTRIAAAATRFAVGRPSKVESAVQLTKPFVERAEWQMASLSCNFQDQAVGKAE